MMRVKKITAAVFLAGFAISTLCGRAPAAQLHVPDQYNTIHDATSSAWDGDEIIVADGTYTGAGNRNISFFGKAITVRSESGPENCIIDCLGLGRGVHFQNGESSNSVLDGLTIINGYVTDGDGGGILCESSNPTITHCILRNNTAYSSRTGVMSFGGGMCNRYSSPTVTECVFSDNQGGWGGGMANLLSSKPKVIRCRFIGNSSQHIGGGMFNTHGSHATVGNCVFIGNSGKTAGGMWNYQSNAKLINCTFSENSALYDGGGINIRESHPILGNCIVWGNRDRGGTDQSAQIHIEDGSLKADFSCIRGWTASLGGTGNMRENPRFVDADGPDDIHGTEDDNLELADDSPCIDAGDNEYVTSITDLNGNPRIRGGTVDMGAYEYQPPDTHYVNINNPTPSPPYTTWTDAATNIQDAVDEADAGDTVLVTNGVYAAGGKVVDGSTNCVAVDKPLSLLSVNGPEATIIDGLGSVRCAYLTNEVILSGFTLTNGLADRGGGVFCTSVTTVVSNCVLTGNNAYGYPRRGGGAGGGAFGGTLIHCTLANNSVSWGRGGGASQGTLSACVLRGNAAPGGRGAGGAGGGVYESTLTYCTLSGNSAVSGGGAAGSTLHHCTLSGNSASRGGGALNSTLNNCMVGGNSALIGGGSADSALNNCTLTGNRASAAGGALFGTLVNCTVVRNYATEAIGGVAMVNVTNCIVYFNSAPMGANYVDTESAALSYTCTYPMPTNGVGNISDVPLLVDTNNWSDLRLRPDSPGIDAGNNDFVTTLTDLDGNPRIRSGTVDMGAYEFQAPPDTHYVSLDNATPSPPYRSWDTAATNIQDAVDAADAGDTVLVTNGVYATGGTVVDGVTNRMAVDKPLSLLSVNGPEQTIIDGQGIVRCAYLANGVTLSGFMLTNGFADRGGGVFCESEDAEVSRCVLSGNTAYGYPGLGGGAYGGTLDNCVLTGNTASGISRRGGRGGAGGGVCGSALNNCAITRNSSDGSCGGAWGCTLVNCMLTGNRAVHIGGAQYGTMVNCTVVGNSASEAVGGVAAVDVANSIVYFNSAPANANYDSRSTDFSYTCTYPIPTNGVGNITNAPLFVDTNNWSNLRFQPNSPCIAAGNNDFVTWDTDLDGNPRIINGVVDMGAYELVPLTPAELVQQLLDMVNESDLRHKRPLLASLEAALASIERDSCHSAEGQLGGFQNKVRAQVSRQDSALAADLITGAGQVITALDCNGSAHTTAKIHSLKRHPNGKMQMKIKGEADKSYILEASTNLLDWKPICVVRPDKEGKCDYEDIVSDKHPCRFYRLVEP